MQYTTKNKPKEGVLLQKWCMSCIVSALLCWHSSIQGMVCKVSPGCRHSNAWWGQDPWKMLTELCTPGLCLPTPQAALPPQATLQLQPKPAEQTQPAGVTPQLQLETVQHEGQASYICRLQVSCYPMQYQTPLAHRVAGSMCFMPPHACHVQGS